MHPARCIMMAASGRFPISEFHLHFNLALLKMLRVYTDVMCFSKNIVFTSHIQLNDHRKYSNEFNGIIIMAMATKIHGSMISQNVCNMGLAQSHVNSITALQYRCIVLQQTYVSQAGLPATFDNV